MRAEVIKLVKRVWIRGGLGAYLVQELEAKPWEGAYYRDPAKAENFRAWWVAQVPQMVLDLGW